MNGSRSLLTFLPVPIAVGDPDGRAVAGAEVTKELEGTEVFEAMQGRADWPTTQSDDEGAFVLEGFGHVLMLVAPDLKYIDEEQQKEPDQYQTVDAVDGETRFVTIE